MIGTNELGLLLDSTIKVSVILAVTLEATPLLGRRSAALRHWVLTTAIVCVSVTPAMQRVVPSWSFGLGTSSSVRQVEPPTVSPPDIGVSAERAVDVIGSLTPERSGAIQRPRVDAGGMLRAGRLIGSTWVAGIGISPVGCSSAFRGWPGWPHALSGS